MSRSIKAIITMTASLVLAACGGGGAASDSTPVIPTAYFAADDGKLYLSELTKDGKDVAVGVVKLADGTAIALTDLAVTPAGNLYGVTFTGLYSISKSDALATRIGTVALNNFNALASDTAARLYTASNTTSALYSIDSTSGVSTLIGALQDAGGTKYLSSGDVTFDASGKLWAAVYPVGSLSTEKLVRVNAATGAVEAVFSTTESKLFGMSNVNGTVYAASNSTKTLYTVDTTSGALTALRTLAFAPNGIMRSGNPPSSQQ